MNHLPPKHVRILAIAPLTRGFGFAVLEAGEKLVDWGVKSVTGNKNVESLAKVKKLIIQYQPGVVVLPDDTAGRSRRAPRICTLIRQIAKLTAKQNVGVELFTSEQVRSAFFTEDKGTKHTLAEILAAKFPEELGSRLPPKRRPWMSEDYRMGIFDAVALALTVR